jgi:hypothetical protein
MPPDLAYQLQEPRRAPGVADLLPLGDSNASLVKIKSSHVLFLVIVLVILALWIRRFWFNDVIVLHRHNEANRSALLQIREAVSIGAPYTDVLTVYWRHRTDNLRLSADSPTTWAIHMPLEFGASDWNLRFEFRDGIITAIYIRTTDGPSRRESVVGMVCSWLSITGCA